MSGRTPEEHIEQHVLEQHWREVAFIHWRVDASQLSTHLPADLEPQLLDGSAWIALTPFRVAALRAPGVSADTLLPEFRETNLRTYVRHRDGRDGLWFLSIDVTSVTSTLGGRLLGAPYHLARGDVDMTGVNGSVRARYRMRRRSDSSIHHDLTVVPGDAIGPDELVDQLTGRWRAFTRIGSRRAGRTMAMPVEHEPWPLRTAELVSIDENLLAAAGLPSPTSVPVVHWSEGVDARFGRPRTI
jgi:uncharacterized protein